MIITDVIQRKNIAEAIENIDLLRYLISIVKSIFVSTTLMFMKQYSQLTMGCSCAPSTKTWPAKAKPQKNKTKEKPKSAK